MPFRNSRTSKINGFVYASSRTVSIHPISNCVTRALPYICSPKKIDLNKYIPFKKGILKHISS